MNIRIALTAWAAMVFSAPGPNGPAVPFSLAVSDQWKDPASYVIDDDGEFQAVAATLKTWGLPFDMLRLDQQRLDRYHFLDRDRAATIWHDHSGCRSRRFPAKDLKSHRTGQKARGRPGCARR